VSAFWIPVVAILGWAVLSAVRIWSRTRIRELQIRERIAMIEKGLVPPPEVDPVAFERAMARHDRTEWPRRRRDPSRQRRAGVTLMGVGFGLMVLISLTDESVRRGIGVGGFLVIFGLAFLINGLLETRAESATVPPRSPVPTGTETPPQE
jgi:hypothetical protein